MRAESEFSCLDCHVVVLGSFEGVGKIRKALLLLEKEEAQDG